MKYRAFVILLLATALCPFAGPSAAVATNPEQEQSESVNKMMSFADELSLNEQQKKVFWPMYTRYQEELKKLQDKRMQLVEQFKASNKNLTDAQATEIIRRYLGLEEQRLGLKRRYIKVFLEKFPPRTVALYFQLENKYQIETDAQLSGKTPLIHAQ